MAVKFKKVKRRVMNGEEEGTFKFYARANSTGVTDLDTLCMLICAQASLSKADVKSVLESLDFAMDYELRGGRTVKLGNVGTFRMSLRSEGATTKKDLTAHNILKGKIIFTPGPTLKEACREVSFKPFEKDEEEKKQENEPEGGL